MGIIIVLLARISPTLVYQAPLCFLHQKPTPIVYYIQREVWNAHLLYLTVSFGPLQQLAHFLHAYTILPLPESFFFLRFGVIHFIRLVGYVKQVAAGGFLLLSSSLTASAIVIIFLHFRYILRAASTGVYRCTRCKLVYDLALPVRPTVPTSA